MAALTTSALTLSESDIRGMHNVVEISDIKFDSHSDFQHVQVMTTIPFGKTLILDGKTQSTRYDEHLYHESLVHPSMLLHKNPKKVFIGGGGEMATAREILRHKSVESVVMVDLDKKVVDICRQELPEWGNGAFEDERCEVFYEDAHAFLKKYPGKFDVIIMDIADPIEAGPGYVLYTEEFYNFAKTKLNPGGILVTQSGPAGFAKCEECFSVIHNTLKTAFKTVVPYKVFIPSFMNEWGFNLAFDSLSAEPESDDDVVTPEQVQVKDIHALNAEIKTRINGELKFYDGLSHVGLFGLPKHVRLALEAESRIMTVDNPVFMA